MWDVTDTEVKTLCTLTISTHTSRVGCDAALPAAFVVSADFYSHIPCGMWQKMRNILVHIVRFLLTHPVWDVTGTSVFRSMLLMVFLLTHPVWDVTVIRRRTLNITAISTHTSRVGCDFNIVIHLFPLFNFYSHIPCGMWRLFKFLLT